MCKNNHGALIFVFSISSHYLSYETIAFISYKYEGFETPIKQILVLLLPIIYLTIHLGHIFNEPFKISIWI